MNNGSATATQADNGYDNNWACSMKFEMDSMTQRVIERIIIQSKFYTPYEINGNVLVLS